MCDLGPSRGCRLEAVLGDQPISGLLTRAIRDLHARAKAPAELREAIRQLEFQQCFGFPMNLREQGNVTELFEGPTIIISGIARRAWQTHDPHCDSPTPCLLTFSKDSSSFRHEV
jgi:hypothetical protein